jgi:hypothetical protein
MPEAERPNILVIWGDDIGITQPQLLQPRQPQFRVPRKVIKGGSFLCADSYCLRYRPAAPAADGRHRHEPPTCPPDRLCGAGRALGGVPLAQLWRHRRGTDGGTGGGDLLAREGVDRPGGERGQINVAGCR